MKSIKDVDFNEKRVIVRADFDVPIEILHQAHDVRVTDPTRIEKCIPTLKLLRKKKAKLFIISHLGRPEGVDPNSSLKTIQPLLEKLLDEKIAFQENLEEKVDGEIVLLENLRFWSEEEKNDSEFAKKLAKFGDIYVNECFSASHRAHASVSALAKLMPSYWGLELEKEVTELEKIFKHPKKPLIAIIGGAKIETKLPAITNLAKIADKVLVGGKLMFEADKENLPENVLVAPDDIATKDIGPQSLQVFAKEISEAKMIVWNGPMGMFEDSQFQNGTLKVAELVARSEAYKIVGGGDTLSALDKLGLLGEMNFVSVGGGAMLEFLGDKKLPALEALGYYDD